MSESDRPLANGVLKPEQLAELRDSLSQLRTEIEAHFGPRGGPSSGGEAAGVPAEFRGGASALAAPRADCTTTAGGASRVRGRAAAGDRPSA